MSDPITKYVGLKGTRISQAQYHKMFQYAADDPEGFWSEQAELYISWIQSWDQVLSDNLLSNNGRWFSGATLNVAANCLDRHLPERGNHLAIIWEGDDPSESQKFTYHELYEQVCRLANGLKSLGIKRGDRVGIYMPMVPEAIIAMLACARIGAIHSVVFAGFSAESLKNRIQSAQCALIITADANRRGGKIIPIKTKVDSIIDECPSVKKVIIVNYCNKSIPNKPLDMWYHDLIATQPTACPFEAMEANDPLFILYTSGSTGKPKGILHGNGGYLLYATMTFQLIFNYQAGQVYWCTADIGWITGHSYGVYGPLASGATVVMFAGIPTYPSTSRFWEVIDKHQVNIFYTAPTTIRSLMRLGDSPIQKTSRRSLELLGTVGEPINPDVWRWYYAVVGEERCPIVDTWWQTETGGIMISPFPGATPLKPGSASWPFFGVELGIVDDQGTLLSGEALGNLVITRPWPGQLLTLYNDHEGYKKNYFSQYPGMYCTGDGAHQDQDGYYWIQGRTDDVINVSGYRVDAVEIENALLSHPDIAESAVVRFAHDIKGQGIFAFVTTKTNITPNQQLADELKICVRKKIGPIAIPDCIQWTDDLPKTRSGKIMRRILCKIANGDTETFGDTSTLANPEVVQIIIGQMKKQ